MMKDKIIVTKSLLFEIINCNIYILIILRNSVAFILGKREIILLYINNYFKIS